MLSAALDSWAKPGMAPIPKSREARFLRSANIHLTIYMEKSIFRNMDMMPSTLFSAIAHDTRLRCLLLLLEYDELCVCELTHAVGAAQPYMSRHLGQLREAGLVTDRREGLWIYYRINPELPAWVVNVLEATAQGVEEVAPFADDPEVLRAMPNRPGAPRCA